MNKPSHYKKEALQALEGKWGKAVLVALIFTSISIVYNVYVNIGVGLDFIIVYLLFFSPILIVYMGARVWVYLAFFDLYKKDENWWKPQFKNSALKLFFTYILLSVFTFLWSLLLIIPGIIKSLSYAQALYIMKDNPEISVMEAIGRSQKMMKGHKWELFWLGLTFIGWALLIIPTLGTITLYVTPYFNATLVAYYEDLKKEGVAEIEQA